jgi:hypothetical protein
MVWKFLERNGEDDGARTRDLRRDRKRAPQPMKRIPFHFLLVALTSLLPRAWARFVMAALLAEIEQGGMAPALALMYTNPRQRTSSPYLGDTLRAMVDT